MQSGEIFSEFLFYKTIDKRYKWWYSRHIESRKELR
nr:MAG TPA: hypothetical protein [Bacteriophage sp.]